jgi:hypothetical protein
MNREHTDWLPIVKHESPIFTMKVLAITIMEYVVLLNRNLSTFSMTKIAQLTSIDLTGKTPYETS